MAQFVERKPVLFCHPDTFLPAREPRSLNRAQRTAAALALIAVRAFDRLADWFDSRRADATDIRERIGDWHREYTLLPRPTIPEGEPKRFYAQHGWARFEIE